MSFLDLFLWSDVFALGCIFLFLGISVDFLLDTKYFVGMLSVWVLLSLNGVKVCFGRQLSYL